MNLCFLPVHPVQYGLWPLLLLLVFSCTRAGTIHVSPDGNDAHDGSQRQPVQSLHRAAELARAHLADRPSRDLVVQLDEGTYRLDRPLELGPRDGGQAGQSVRYQARPGTRPVVSGGWELTGFSYTEHGL